LTWLGYSVIAIFALKFSPGGVYREYVDVISDRGLLDIVSPPRNGDFGLRRLSLDCRQVTIWGDVSVSIRHLTTVTGK
jgi:hypothetical protein